MNEQEVIDLMTSATSEADWNAKCDEVKRRCGGYPSFWFQTVILSGLATRVTAKFGSNADIRVTVIEPKPSAE